MVISSINNKINYNETKSIHQDDVDHETSIFNGDIYGKKIAFVLGKPKFDYITNNIIYFYIYLVKNNKEFIKIGLYESNDKYSTILDESNEINEFKQKLESSELTISSENEYDSGMGIKILSPELKVRLNGTASITGKVLWSYGELSKI